MENLCPRLKTKRGLSHHNGDYEAFGGRPKRHAPDESQTGQTLTSSVYDPKLSTETVFRIICPESRAGSVIGKGGSIVKSLRHETGAKIMIADAAEGTDDRVIFISSANVEHQGIENKDEFNKTKEETQIDINKSKEFFPSAQNALLKVYDHIIEGNDLKGKGELAEVSPQVVARLLVPASQVGCVLGKGGKIIEQMREETKTKIRILPCDKLLLGAMTFDEILQVTGDPSAVRNALSLVAKRLYENPPHEQIQFSSIVFPRAGLEDFDISSRSVSTASRVSELHHPRYMSHSPDIVHSIVYPRGFQSGVAEVGWPGKAAKDGVTFRILCPIEKIGGIIGKGGSIIRSLQEEIGVKIKVMDPVAGANERIVSIFSIEHQDDDISPAQEALLHIQSKISDLGTDEDAVITSRLLVPSDQVGCLLGKGGSIITEIRKLTGANIRILGREDLPKCAPPNDELVQIVGDIRVAREALIQITERLRKKAHQKKLHLGPGDSLVRLTDSKQLGITSPRRMEFTRPGIHSLGSPSYPVIPSSGSWTGQDVPGARTFRDYDNQSIQLPADYRLTGALVTRTTIEVMIPARAVASIIEDGGNKIIQIRQMSGAKVNLLDIVSGTSEGIVQIAGTPEQTRGAQRLLQELILNGKT